MRPSITRVLVPAGTNDVVDLDTVKDELSITSTDTSKDAFLGRAITQMSQAAASYCNRVFPLETVQDTFHGSGGVPWHHADASPWFYGSLQLSRWPIADGLLGRTATSASAAGDSTLTIDNSAGITAGIPVGHAAVPDGTVVSSIVGNVATLSAALTASVAAGDAVIFGVVVAIQGSAGDVATPRSILPAADFEVDQEAGILVRHHAYWHNGEALGAQTTVTYRGGFGAMPADLQDAVLRAVTARYAARGRDPLLREMQQPVAGQQTYWIGTMPGQRGGFTGEIAEILDYYANR